MNIKNINNINFVCPSHKINLSLSLRKDALICQKGCTFHIIKKIPRFVPMQNYASSFGMQWNKFRKTQLDSYTKIEISKNRLRRIAGGTLAIFNNKNVLEVGCGAGRFTEVMLEAGARVYAIDISSAVEANYENNREYKNITIAQADILHAPFLSEQFDIVVCVGVIQHTPDPENTIEALCSYIKPGGILLMDHYSYGYPTILSRKILRKFLLKRGTRFRMLFCVFLVTILWPLHRILWRLRNKQIINKLRLQFLNFSPVVDYHDAYIELGPKLLYKWALLDTHDTLTDHYKHLRSAEEITNTLLKCSMRENKVAYAGNGVEVKAIKSIKIHKRSKQ